MKNNKIEFIDKWENFPVNYRFLDCRKVEDKTDNDKGIKLSVSALKTESYWQYGFYKHISKLV